MRVFEIMYAKNFNDGRNVTEEMLSEVASSFKPGSKIPVAKGHTAAIGSYDDTQPAEGWVKAVKFREDTGKLYAKVELLPDMEEAYKEGKFKSWSVGIHTKKIRDDDGEIVGREPWQLGHLAMLGATEAAFKDLQEVEGFEFSFNKDGYKHSDECITYTDGKTDWLKFSNCIVEDAEPEEKEDNIETAEIETNSKEDIQMSKKEEKIEAAQNVELSAIQAERDVFAAQVKEYEEKMFANTMQVFDSKNEAVYKLAEERGISKESDIGKKLAAALESEKENYKIGEDIKHSFADAIESILNHLKPAVTAEEIELKNAEANTGTPNFLEAARKGLI